MPQFRVTLALPACFHQVDVPDVREIVFNCPDVDAVDCDAPARRAFVTYREAKGLAEMLSRLEEAGFPATVVSS